MFAQVGLNPQGPQPGDNLVVQIIGEGGQVISVTGDDMTSGRGAAEPTEPEADLGFNSRSADAQAFYRQLKNDRELKVRYNSTMGQAAKKKFRDDFIAEFFPQRKVTVKEV